MRLPELEQIYRIRIILWRLSTCLLTGGGCGVIGKGGATAPEGPSFCQLCSPPALGTAAEWGVLLMQLTLGFMLLGLGCLGT